MEGVSAPPAPEDAKSEVVLHIHKSAVEGQREASTIKHSLFWHVPLIDPAEARSYTDDKKWGLQESNQRFLQERKSESESSAQSFLEDQDLAKPVPAPPPALNIKRSGCSSWMQR